MFVSPYSLKSDGIRVDSEKEKHVLGLCSFFIALSTVVMPHTGWQITLSLHAVWQVV